MKAGSYVESASGEFAYTTTFIRQRAVIVSDPYDPDAEGVPDWTLPEEIEVSGYFASQASVEQSSLAAADPVRDQVVTTKQLVLDDPSADVERGDRIKQGSHVWTVTGFPATDVNPFTGWQPTRVCNLVEGVG